jgi:flagellar FliL protein
MSDKKDNKAAEAGTAPKKPPMMIIIIVVAVIAMAAMFVVGKQVSAKAKPAVKKVEHGPVMSLDEFLVNLSDSDGDHFLKVTVGLGLDKEKGKTPETLKEQVPMIRDAVLSSLSSKMRAEVSSADGREKLKADIKKRVNTALGENDVDDVYFSNFVTQ